MINKFLNTVSVLMMLVPWTILPLRCFEWALKSPAAEIMISCYAAFMIFSGIFTIYIYVKRNLRNNMMKVCLIVNGLYAVFGIAAFGLMGMWNNVSYLSFCNRSDRVLHLWIPGPEPCWSGRWNTALRKNKWKLNIRRRGVPLSLNGRTGTPFFMFSYYIWYEGVSLLKLSAVAASSLLRNWL